MKHQQAVHATATQLYGTFAHISRKAFFRSQMIPTGCAMQEAPKPKPIDLNETRSHLKTDSRRSFIDRRSSLWYVVWEPQLKSLEGVIVACPTQSCCLRSSFSPRPVQACGLLLG